MINVNIPDAMVIKVRLVGICLDKHVLLNAISVFLLNF